MKTPNKSAFAQILAISGVNEYLFAAIQKQSGQIFERVGQSHLAHGEQIVGLCDALLEEATLTLADLDAITVDIGPGSFTGQRISLSFAKGLGLALGKPLIGLDSFSIWHGRQGPNNQNVQSPDNNGNNEDAALPLVFGAKEPCEAGAGGPVLIVIDGRKRRFYTQLRAAGAAHSGQTQKNGTDGMEVPDVYSNNAESYQMTWDLSAGQLYQTLKAQLKNLTSNPNGKSHVLRLGGPGTRLFQSELAKTAPPESCPLWQAIQAAIPPMLGSQSKTEPGIFRLLAQNMLHLAQEAHITRNYMKASDGPFYLRKSDAQEQQEQKTEPTQNRE